MRVSLICCICGLFVLFTFKMGFLGYLLPVLSHCSTILSFHKHFCSPSWSPRKLTFSCLCLCRTILFCIFLYCPFTVFLSTVIITSFHQLISISSFQQLCTLQLSIVINTIQLLSVIYTIYLSTVLNTIFIYTIAFNSYLHYSFQQLSTLSNFSKIINAIYLSTVIKTIQLSTVINNI